MNAFEFAFTIFGLVLGLALAEVIGGFVRALKARRPSADAARTKIRVGWLTPMLGILVTMDLITFWLGAWEMQEAVRVHFPSLLFAAVLAGIYYAAASLVWPDDPELWPDYDAYFLAHKGQVAAGIFAANLIFSIAEYEVAGMAATGMQIPQLVYVALAATLIVANGRWLSLALMGGMLAVFAGFWWMI